MLACLAPALRATLSTSDIVIDDATLDKQLDEINPESIALTTEIDAVTRARMLNVSNPTRICKATRVGFMRSGEIF